MKNKAHMANLIMEYETNLQTFNILQARRVEILLELQELTGGVSTVIGDYQFTSRLQKANAPYKKIVTELLPDIDLDAWRGPSVIHNSISRIKK